MKRTRFTCQSVLGATLAAIMLAGCGNGGGNGGGGATASGKKPVEVAFVTNNVSDYWTIANAGTDAAVAADPSITVDFKKPADGTAAEQRQIIDDLLSKGVQAIAISPVDPADETDLINNTVKKGVLVITQDSDAPKSDRACYVGTDNEKAGEQAGEEIKKALPNGGNIMVFVGKIDAQNAADRYAGIKKVLAGTNIKILDVRTDNTDHTRAVANVLDALVKDPTIACCVGLWSYNGPAILNALKQENKQGKIKIVCFDEEDDTLQGIKDGYISATIVQQPYEFGKQAVEMMAAYLRGDKSVIPADKMHIIPTQVINKANVDDFETKLNKLRGKS